MELLLDSDGSLGARLGNMGTEEFYYSFSFAL
jgi:hypothetical protein